MLLPTTCVWGRSCYLGLNERAKKLFEVIVLGGNDQVTFQVWCAWKGRSLWVTCAAVCVWEGGIYVYISLDLEALAESPFPVTFSLSWY